MDNFENVNPEEGLRQEHTGEPVSEQPAQEENRIPEQPAQEENRIPEQPEQEEDRIPVQPEQQAEPQPAPRTEIRFTPPTEGRQEYRQPNPGYADPGLGRKESPFADSPYVMNRPNPYQNPYQYHQPPQPQKPKKEKKQRKPAGKAVKGIVAAVLALAVLCGACTAAVAVTNNRWFEKTAAMNTEYRQQLEELEKRLEKAEKAAASVNQGTAIPGDPVYAGGSLSASQVYAMNVNSVVAISNHATTNIYGQLTEMASSGSGFIISEDGYVVSNYHVVEGADKLTVITYDGAEYPAKLVGYDQSNDVSLLKIDAVGLDPVAIGSSDALIVGDQVVAIGNPLGELTSTLTVGYISAKDRTINTDGTYNINMMQTDAAINSGNSGGPLFNMNGEVIGITTAKYSGSSNSGASIEGIGFAIPMDDVMGILDDLRNYGYVKGCYLGVSVVTMDPAVAEAYGLPTGSKVSLVEGGSCAMRAGVMVGDIITGMGGYDVAGNSDLLSILRKFKPGDTTTITVFRSGQTLELTITLDEKPAPEATQPQTEPQLEPTEPQDTEGMPEGNDWRDWYDYWYDRFFGE